MAAEIRLFTCLTDNFGALIHDPATKATASIDAPEAGPILKALEHEGWQLTDILITHHHHDHVGGVAALKQKYNCRVVAPHDKSTKIANVDLRAAHGDVVKVGGLLARVLETPGHTLDHISYVFDNEKTLFAADLGRRLLSVYDVGSARLITHLPLAVRPDNLCFNHDGGQLFVTGEGMDAVVDQPRVALRHRRRDRRGHGGHGLGVRGEERADLLHVELTGRGIGPARRVESQQVLGCAHEERGQVEPHDVGGASGRQVDLDRDAAPVARAVGYAGIAVAVGEAHVGAQRCSLEVRGPAELGGRGRGRERCRAQHPLGVSGTVTRVGAVHRVESIDETIADIGHDRRA